MWNSWFSKVPWPALTKVALLIFLIISGNLVATWFVDGLSVDIRPSNEEAVHKTLMVSAASYALLIAIPFVPGVEVGFAILAMLGPPIVFLVYVSTLVGLTISYTVGRLIPLHMLSRGLDLMRFQRTSQLVNMLEPMTQDERLAFLVSKSPSRLIPFLLRHRYIALIVAINLPGNFLIGGGGGISLVAGVSKLFSAPGFFASIAIAVAPVPLLVVLFGKSVLLD